MKGQYTLFKVLFFLQLTAFLAVLVNFYLKADVVPANVYGRACHQRVEEVLRAAQSTCPVADAGPRGPLSNCTLADVQRRPGLVLLTTTNLGFLDMTLNMLESIRRTGLCINTTVVAEDRRCYDYLTARAAADPAVSVALTDSGQTRSSEIGRGHRSEYYAFFNKRQQYVLALLRQGYEVLFSDADTFWFKDPLPYFRGDYDVSMMDPRSPYPQRTSKSHYCAGFVYFKPTPVTVSFVEEWIRTMDEKSRKGATVADQNVMNNLLKADKPVHVNIQPLDYNLFPWGPKYYELLGKNPGYSAVVMHAASIRGKAAKIAKFKTSNMWLVNKTVDELIGEGPAGANASAVPSG